LAIFFFYFGFIAELDKVTL